MSHSENQTLDKTQSQLEFLQELGKQACFAHYKECIVAMYAAAQHCEYYSDSAYDRVANYDAFANLHNFFAKLAMLDDPDCNGANLL